MQGIYIGNTKILGWGDPTDDVIRQQSEDAINQALVTNSSKNYTGPIITIGVLAIIIIAYIVLKRKKVL